MSRLNRCSFDLIFYSADAVFVKVWLIVCHCGFFRRQKIKNIITICIQGTTHFYSICKMEKFSNWRDKATGISPFMPIPFPNSTQNKGNTSNNKYSTKFNKFIYQLVLFFTKLPLFLTKLPFFIIASILYAITGLHIFLRFVFTFLFGFAPIRYAVDGIKSSQVEKLRSYEPQRGDLIIANYSSPLDGYIIASIAQTTNIIILVPDKTGTYFSIPMEFD